MRLGVFIPLRMGGSGQPNAEQIADHARWIEDAGLDGIWSLDTLAPQVQPRPDPFSSLLVAGLATKHVELGTAVYVVSNRNPVDVTQRILTLEALLPGRFTYGVGAGSTKSADDAVGTVFEDRFRNLYRNMDVIRRLCAGDHVGEAFFNPPAGTRPRFILGAWASDTSLKRAIADFDGWMSSGGRTKAGVGTATLAGLAGAIERYRELGGTKRAMVSTVAFDLRVPGTGQHLGEDEPFNLRCPPDEASWRLERIAAMGYDDLMVNAQDFTYQDMVELRSLLPRHNA